MPPETSTQSAVAWPDRAWRPPAHLRDFVCKFITHQALPAQSATSGTVHPLSNFLAYDRFYPSHLMRKLKKSLYGLRRTPLQWHSKLASALKDYGFIQCLLDHSLFMYRRGHVFLALSVYLDDIVLTGSSPSHCHDFKEYLHKCFKLKALGPLKYICDMTMISCLLAIAHLTVKIF